MLTLAQGHLFLGVLIALKMAKFSGRNSVAMFGLIWLVCFSTESLGDQNSQGRELRGDNAQAQSAVFSEFERRIALPSPTQLIDIEIPESDAGSTVGAKIRLVNKLSRSVKLNTVHKSCSCMRAKVPHVMIDVDDSNELEFEFDIEKRPTKLEQRFSATIYCEGGCNLIQISFRCRLKNAVVFQSTDLVGEYARTENSKVIEIPIDTSDTTLLKKTDVAFSDELESMRGKFLEKDGRWLLQAEFEPRSLRNSISQGEVAMIRDKKTVAVARLTLRERQPVEILPAPLNFYRRDDGSREAMAIVRFAGNTPVGVRNIELRGEEKNIAVATVHWQRMSDTRFRIQVVLPVDSECFSNKTMTFRLETSSGQVHPVTVLYSLSD